MRDYDARTKVKPILEHGNRHRSFSLGTVYVMAETSADLHILEWRLASRPEVIGLFSWNRDKQDSLAPREQVPEGEPDPFCVVIVAADNTAGVDAATERLANLPGVSAVRQVSEGPLVTAHAGLDVGSVVTSIGLGVAGNLVYDLAKFWSRWILLRRKTRLCRPQFMSETHFGYLVRLAVAEQSERHGLGNMTTDDLKVYRWMEWERGSHTHVEAWVTSRADRSVEAHVTFRPDTVARRGVRVTLRCTAAQDTSAREDDGSAHEDNRAGDNY